MSTQSFGQKVCSKETLWKTRHLWEDDITFSVILYRLYLFKKEQKLGVFGLFVMKLASVCILFMMHIC